MYEWIRAFHIIFLVTWFAGLFYLPRLYVYHAMPENKSSFELFKVMERRLFGIMTIGAVLTAVFGIWMIILSEGVILQMGWFHAKALLLLLLIVYHYFCWRLMQTFRTGENLHSHKWYRYFNEIPGLLLILIVIFAVVKPF
ncbi:protoporphyrinogen oxidase HemJ [uncultured Thiothrix sp.]|jgi:putative membrane protein|uniref:protoporphyrinogen oxidase HemJ n=1 Tax=uncultured Thiothrix sp. TaxID=223185 RepID=UPI00261F21C0|nr:protoporphyrinogen oxidase HemJ [uncultured Thiothrix sp.]HMT91886.1 protoporphyrinogen oxidase HemJ [Thiolinea sp.]